MKKNKYIVIILSAVLIIIIICCCLIFTPVKYAVSKDSLNKSNRPYFLLQWIQITGSEWVIIGDQNGLYENPKYIVAKGNVPSAIENYNIATGNNTYICYGNFIGYTDIHEDIKLETYQFTDWDILYPIKRNLPIEFWPKGYICKLDEIFK